MALFAFKSSLRLKLGLSFNRFVVISERHIRGRIRTEFPTEAAEESDDFELTEIKANQRNRFDKRDHFSEDQLYDSRKISDKSFDKFERAKYGLNQRQQNYYNKDDNKRDNFDRRDNFNTNYNQMNDNYNRNNQNYRRNNYPNSNQNNYQNRNRNEYFDNRSDSRSDNRYNNRFDSRSDNRYNNRFDNRSERSDRFDKNRYQERKQREDYKNFKQSQQINEFSHEDNAIYNIDKQFSFESEDQRPRFSRFREIEKNIEKRKRFQKSDENDLDSEEFETNEGEEQMEEQSHTKIREKIPLPFNVTMENRFEVLNHIVMPLHLKPYNIQLSIKYKTVSEVLRKLGRRLKQINSPVINDPKGLPCPIELVKPSPMTERYRNKDEFSIWPGVDGFTKTLGFFVGQPSIHENVVCVEPDHIIVSRESNLSVAKKFQNYLRDVTEYDCCANYGEGGNWRRFHVRSNSSGQHMISAIMHPQDLTQQQLDEEMEKLRQYFKDDQRISSMYFQASRHTRLSNEKEPYVHLFGDRTITDTLFDKKFEISVDSFFQINTSAAEVLYRNVMTELNASRNTTVLDICCGAGVLATIMAPDVCRVIGIDSSVSAINDAQRNAVLNGVTNVSFIAGKVEEKLPQLMDELYSKDIVVVANPTRAGLVPSVINTLRELKFIRKIVYVSCKPEGTAFKNFTHLCMPSGRSGSLGSPFVPTNAIPVDLFPQTNHCELIVTFERF